MHVHQRHWPSKQLQRIFRCASNLTIYIYISPKVPDGLLSNPYSSPYLNLLPFTDIHSLSRESLFKHLNMYPTPNSRHHSRSPHPSLLVSHSPTYISLFYYSSMGAVSQPNATRNQKAIKNSANSRTTSHYHCKIPFRAPFSFFNLNTKRRTEGAVVTS